MEIEASTYKEGRIDTPLAAVKFLKRFLIQNEHLLKQLNVSSTQAIKTNLKEFFF